MRQTKLILKARLVIEHRGDILLLEQTSTNGGKYTLVGGTVENHELIKAALIRESMEEAGIEIKSEDLKLVHTLHKKKGTKETRIVLYFRATHWSGDLMSREPDKFTKTAWFPLLALPPNLSPTVRHFLNHYRRGSYFSEFQTKMESPPPGPS
ncbi:MAG: NUDIX domain-containing protein [Bacteroidota bacterium]